MQIAAFARDWPYSHPRPTPETNDHYASMVRGFTAEYGHRYMDELSNAEAQRWSVAHPSAVRYVRAMFTDAIRDGVIGVNPFVGVKVPRAPRRRREEHVPTHEEVTRLLDASSGALYRAVSLGAFAGLRQSEILAAQWSAYTGETLYVFQQLGRNGSLKPLKGKIKERTVDVFKPTRMALGSALGIGDEDRIVPLTHSELRSEWERARDGAEVKCEFHQLRTFCASWLLELGCSPIDVAVQLHGHTDPTVVLSYYAFIDKGRALDRLRRVVDGDR